MHLGSPHDQHTTRDGLLTSTHDSDAQKYEGTWEAPLAPPVVAVVPGRILIKIGVEFCPSSHSDEVIDATPANVSEKKDRSNHMMHLAHH